jgi:hypothetical protein
MIFFKGDRKSKKKSNFNLNFKFDVEYGISCCTTFKTSESRSLSSTLEVCQTLAVQTPPATVQGGQGEHSNFKHFVPIKTLFCDRTI